MMIWNIVTDIKCFFFFKRQMKSWGTLRVKLSHKACLDNVHVYNIFVNFDDHVMDAWFMKGILNYWYIETILK